MQSVQASCFEKEPWKNKDATAAAHAISTDSAQAASFYRTIWYFHTKRRLLSEGCNVHFMGDTFDDYK